MASQAGGRVEGTFVQRVPVQGAAPATIKVPRDAIQHYISIGPDGASPTAGTATLEAIPCGQSAAVPVYEADGATPVSLDMVNTDARADIAGSLDFFVVTPVGYDGTNYLVYVSSAYE